MADSTLSTATTSLDSGFAGCTGKKPNVMAQYPPTANLSILGYVREISGARYSRDLGRSFELGGRVYYLFGDTFCFNSFGEYVGLVNNSAALVPNRSEPLVSQYLGVRDDGLVNPLVPFTAEERESMGCEEGMRDDKDGCARVILWGFGGVVEIQEGIGLHFFEKAIIGTDGCYDFCGMGVAKIFADEGTGALTADRETLSSPNTMLFPCTWPRFGSMSSVLHENHLYLFGGMPGNFDTIVVARAHVDHFAQRDCYKFWTGSIWSKDWNEAQPVLGGIQQGAIFWCPLFGPARPWVVVGCNKCGDSQIQVAAAGSLVGPWEPVGVALAEGINYKDDYMYCMYPHAWAFGVDGTELLVTWSEHWPGEVVAGRLSFAQAEQARTDEGEMAAGSEALTASLEE